MYVGEEDMKEYSLEELIDLLKTVSRTGEGNINIPGAYLCLAKEIAELKHARSGSCKVDRKGAI